MNTDLRFRVLPLTVVALAMITSARQAAPQQPYILPHTQIGAPWLGFRKASDEMRREWEGEEPDIKETIAGRHLHDVKFPVMVSSLAFGSGSKQLFCGMADGTVRILDADSGKQVANVRFAKNSITDLAVSPDGRELIVGCAEEKLVRTWDLIAGKVTAEFKPAKPFLAVKIALSAGGHYAAIAGKTSETYIHSFSSLGVAEKDAGGNVWREIQGHAEVDHRKDLDVYIYETRSGKLLRTVRCGDWDLFRPIALSRDGNSLAVSSKNGAVQLWRSHGTKASVDPLAVVEDATLCSFCPDDSLLATIVKTENNPTIMHLLKTSTGKKTGKYQLAWVNPERLLDIAPVFSPDGNSVAYCQNEPTGKERDRVAEQFNPSYLFNSGLGEPSPRYRTKYGPRVCIYNVKTSKKFYLPSDKQEIRSFCFSPDGSRLAALPNFSRYNATSVRIWELPTEGSAQDSDRSTTDKATSTSSPRPATAQKDAQDDGSRAYVDLINAASFGRWTNTGGRNVFKLGNDGSLRASGGRSYLISPHAYDEFELTGRMKVSRGGNGGIFFGVPAGLDMQKPLGYELQLYIRKSAEESGTAGLWLDGKPIRASLRSFEVPDRWYSFYIRLKRGSVLVKIDDKEVHNLAAEHRAGHIALQCYSHEGEVHFSDLKVRDLTARQGSVSDADGANLAADEARTPALPEPARESSQPAGESLAERRRVANEEAKVAEVTKGEFRTWTNSTGTRTIRAQFLGGDEERVQLRLANGRVLTSRLERFSEKDREFVRERLKSMHQLSGRFQLGAVLQGRAKQPGFGLWACRLEISETQGDVFRGFLHLDAARSGRAATLVGASLEIEGQLHGSDTVEFTVTRIRRQSRHRDISLGNENIGLVYRGTVRGNRIVGQTYAGSSAGNIAMQFTCPPVPTKVVALNTRATSPVPDERTGSVADATQAHRPPAGTAPRESVDPSAATAASDALQMAIRSFYGTTGTIDTAQAKLHLTKAVDAGNPVAKLYLAHFLNIGECRYAMDSARAQQLARDSIDQVATEAQSGNRDACFAYGLCFENGLGVAKGPSAAANWLRIAAEQGHARAQFKLGWLYLEGSGVEANRAEGLKWLQLAAANNDARAIDSIGDLYVSGKHGFDKDSARGTELTRKAAEMGDWKAQRNLGVSYLRGIGVERNEAEAINWMLKSAEQSCEVYTDLAGTYCELGNHAEGVKWSRKAWDAGVAKGAHVLGVCYELGRGVGKDPAEALTWYERAAEQGYADAQCRLGATYMQGIFTPPDPAKAVEWFRKAAENGHARSQVGLGALYAHGLGVEQDWEKAVDWTRKAADQGLAEAQTVLGAAYDKGQGVEQDLAQAVKWYSLAAEQGYAPAQATLGNFYASGDGVEEDQVEAVNWFRKSAEQGNALGQRCLGESYEIGKGVSQDFSEALKWYQLAAEQGDSDAINNIGRFYENGRGVAQDFAEAIGWYRKAAENGNPHAQYNLALLYEAGRGVPQDSAEAVKWLRLAVDQEHAESQNNLGVHYMKGSGVEQDEDEARKLWRKAAEQGHDGARQNLDMYERLQAAATTARITAPPSYSYSAPGVLGGQSSFAQREKAYWEQRNSHNRNEQTRAMQQVDHTQKYSR